MPVLENAEKMVKCGNILAILPIRAHWKGLCHYLTAVFLESNYEMSSSHHEIEMETRTSRHSPDRSQTALPLKNVAKSGAVANICQVFAVVLTSLLTLAVHFQWEISSEGKLKVKNDFEKFDYKTFKTEFVFGLFSYALIFVMYIHLYLFRFWSFSDF